MKEYILRFKDLEFKDRPSFTSDECNSYEVWDLVDDERFLKMDYTQKTDIEGTKIFEGDVISAVQFHDTSKIVGDPWLVYYNEERLTFYWKNGFADKPFWEYDLKSVKYKVIGNIYDNPALLLL